MVEIASVGGFILLVLNIWAIVSIVGSGAGTGGKVIWVLLVLIMPVVGFILWLLFGPRGRKAGF
ncbi:MAG: PLDc N-terminal domain-containing protein [Roseobacter sp.]